MSRILQIRRGTTAQNDKFTGLAGEISFDTDAKTLRVHDGVKLGGYPLMRADDDSAGDASGGDSGTQAPAFDINSVPDEFWAKIVTKFAPSYQAPALPQIVATREFELSSTTSIEYIMNTEKSPIFVVPVLVCKKAECGYKVGDEVSAFGLGAMPAPALNVSTDQNGIHMTLMIGGKTFWVAHNETGVNTNITNGNWRLKFLVYC